MTSADNVRVDVIIPIYNAYEDLTLCIESLKKYMDFNRHSLILINDNSTDERIKPYLDGLDFFPGSVHVIHNSVNKGFSGNVNMGMRMSENDVILLNSDTIVTKDWIGKMAECAHSRGNIATVTPLSNNATLCSVPDFCMENDIPAGMSIDDMAAIVETVSAKEYPKIPVAHGFCMYIKRKVIDEIGFFDEETFKKGYGEENDYCYRAIQAGYVHVMCDDTFIYHKGSSSFISDEKKELMAAHQKALEERYPDEDKATAEHCRTNPNKHIGDIVRVFMKLREKKSILYLLQSDFKEGASNNCGGTQLHVKDLTMKLREKYNIFVVARDRDCLNLTIYTANESINREFYIGEPSKTPVFTDEKLRLFFSDILDAFDIDEVHIHHIISLSYDMFYEAGKRGIPIIVSMHDHYFICPNSTLTVGGRYCQGKESSDCAGCLTAATGVYQAFDYLKLWRARSREALGMAEKIIVPSNYLKKTVEDIFPELSDKIKVIAHGTDVPDVPKYSESPNGIRLQNDVRPQYDIKPQDDIRPRHNFNEKFNVAFIGGLSIVKGSENAYQMIKHSPKSIVWHIFGEISHGKLEGHKQDNLIKTGHYDRNDLGNLLRKYEIDLVCILSICPETFCYTLSESIANKVPVLVTRIGAMTERMEMLKCGWTVPYTAGYEEILEQIDNIRANGPEYDAVMERIHSVKLRDVTEMVLDYDAVYSEYINEPRQKNLEKANAARRLFTDKKYGEGITDEDYEYLKLCRDKIKILEGMFLYRLAYKIVNKLASVKFPGKRYFMKKVLGRTI